MSDQGSFVAAVDMSCLSLVYSIDSILSCPLALNLLSFADAVSQSCWQKLSRGH